VVRFDQGIDSDEEDPLGKNSMQQQEMRSKARAGAL
jgi:hypothetical protein